MTGIYGIWSTHTSGFQHIHSKLCFTPTWNSEWWYRNTKSVDIRQVKGSTSFSMERRWSGHALHDGNSAASWRTILRIWICIITTRPLLYANEVHLTQHSGTIKVRSNCQTRQYWSNMKQDSVSASPIPSRKMFTETYFSALSTWKMRKFVTGPPSWKDLS